jgi:hypothetical protein
MHPSFNNWVTQIILTKIQSLQSEVSFCEVVISTKDQGIQLTFYPSSAPSPILNMRRSTGQYFITHPKPSSPDHVAKAASAANKTNVKGQANVVMVKDPSIETIGIPSNLHNYLLDLGTTKHMTPCL